MDKSCSKCAYYQEPEALSGNTAGSCHAEAPKVFMVPVGGSLGGQPQIGFQSVFPPVRPIEWCGKFQPRLPMSELQ